MGNRDPKYAFSGEGAESIGPMWFQTKSRAGPTDSVDRPRDQARERIRRTTLLSSSAMSLHRLFLDRVARRQSPSPLHRRPQINMHSSRSGAKGTLLVCLDNTRLMVDS